MGRLPRLCINASYALFSPSGTSSLVTSGIRATSPPYACYERYTERNAILILSQMQQCNTMTTGATALLPCNSLTGTVIGSIPGGLLHASQCSHKAAVIAAQQKERRDDHAIWQSLCGARGFGQHWSGGHASQ